MPIALGAVVINTMPMWLTVLASVPNHSETLADGLGSCVLLSAAMSCAARLQFLAPGVARIAIPLAFAVLAADVDKKLGVLVVTCLVLGLALSAATITGAASYWVVTPNLRGVSIVANGFFLFP